MMSDRGVSPEFLPEALDSSWFGGVDRLHITGYSLIAEPFAYTAMAAAHQADPAPVEHRGHGQGARPLLLSAPQQAD